MSSVELPIAARPVVETIPHSVRGEKLDNGALLLRAIRPLGPVVRNTGVWLHAWAEKTPSRVFIAERSGAGWREHGYAETLQMVRAIASSLLARGLGPDRPVAVLSGNGVDHGLLALAAQYAGIPLVPLAEQYSLIRDARDRLRYVLAKVHPGLAYVSDAGRYAAALEVEELEGAEIVASVADGARSTVTRFADLLRGTAGMELDRVHARVGPDTLAKILFTSGSSAAPKGVCTTHGMMCVNQAQIAACYPFLTQRPPKLLDWLPWNHVFGGSHNFNMMLANGGSLYIDQGKPTTSGFSLSLQNIREHAGSLSFNVPVAYSMLLAQLRQDAALRKAFFWNLDMVFYAGASLPQDVWQGIEDLAMRETGTAPILASSWGMTETAPAAIMVHEPVKRSGIIGVPVPGVTVKLLPEDDARYELRVTGPNVMAGYFHEPEITAAAFDSEGYLITGDAVRLVDPDDLNAGLIFDGRIAEDFKLGTGTWIRASQLRLSALEGLAPLASDAVITGHDRDEIGLLIFSDPDALLAFDPSAYKDEAGAWRGEALTAEISRRLTVLAEHSTGSSMRIGRALVVSEPPSVRDHEITAKGNLNPRKVLTRRADLVARLYDDDDVAVARI